jgi:DNA-binding transcriptional regulator YhcF (GntR family)
MEYTYSDAVTAAFRQARDEAEAANDDAVGPLHMLLGLLQQESGAAAEVFAELGIDRAALAVRVRESVPPGKAFDQPSGRELPYTLKAKRMIEATLATARGAAGEVGRAASVSVDSDHLLHALMTEWHGVPASVLGYAGVSVAALAEAVGRRIGDGGDDTATRPTGAGDGPPRALQDPVWFLEVDPSSSVPIYEQIIARVEEAVATGRLLAGERLPAVRELAGELGVAPGTVARAYSTLEQRGVLTTDRARGTRIADRRAVAEGSAAWLVAALADLLRPVVVAAFHMGGRAPDVHAALDLAMQDIFPTAT